MISPLPQWVPEITPAGVGIWSLLTVVTVALIKAWPVIQLQAIQAKDRLRGEGRSDLSDCRSRIDALQAKLEAQDTRHEEAMMAMSHSVHKIEMKLVGAISGYRILHTEVRLTNPDSIALKQAEAVLSAAFTLSPSTDGAFSMPERQ